MAELQSLCSKRETVERQVRAAQEAHDPTTVVDKDPGFKYSSLELTQIPLRRDAKINDLETKHEAYMRRKQDEIDSMRLEMKTREELFNAKKEAIERDAANNIAHHQDYIRNINGNASTPPGKVYQNNVARLQVLNDDIAAKQAELNDYSEKQMKKNREQYAAQEAERVQQEKREEEARKQRALEEFNARRAMERQEEAARHSTEAMLKASKQKEYKLVQNTITGYAIE